VNIDLSGKTALVTGGNIGIGRAISLKLAECGADVALTYFSHPEAGEETVSQIRTSGRSGHLYNLDVTMRSEVDAVVAEAASALGGQINILVANAGHLVRRVPVEQMDDDHWHQVINVNLSSVFYCVRAVLPYMGDTGGRIVTMASTAARNGGGSGATAYAAAKAGVIGFTRGLAKELAPRRITVNSLAPGFILDTPFHEQFTEKSQQAAIIQSIPLKRAGTPEDVANAVLYYVSEMGEWITGQVAEINGGIWFV
jgi:3-oxoacyl-[acyl-carrier protein] reductase